MIDMAEQEGQAATITFLQDGENIANNSVNCKCKFTNARQESFNANP